MGFYGIKTDYDKMIKQLTQQIELLESTKVNSTYQNLVLSKQINFSTFGAAIVQSILSMQYSSSCIGVYFKREWVQPVLKEFSPIINAYHLLPSALTEFKGETAQRLSKRERIAISNMFALWTCAQSLRASPFGLLRGIGGGAAAFFLSSWILLPELGERYLKISAYFL